MFLTPQEKANKALTYRLLDKRPVQVKEMGDALQVSYQNQPNTPSVTLPLSLPT